MGKLNYLLFLSLGTYIEAFRAFDIDTNAILEIIYVIGWFALLFSKKVPWIKILSIYNIGMASLFMLIIDLFIQIHFVHQVYHIFCVLMLAQCVIYFQNYENSRKTE